MHSPRHHAPSPPTICEESRVPLALSFALKATSGYRFRSPGCAAHRAPSTPVKKTHSSRASVVRARPGRGEGRAVGRLRVVRSRECRSGCCVSCVEWRLQVQVRANVRCFACMCHRSSGSVSTYYKAQNSNIPGGVSVTLECVRTSYNDSNILVTGVSRLKSMPHACTLSIP